MSTETNGNCYEEIMICIDPKPLRKVLKRDHYPLLSWRTFCWDCATHRSSPNFSKLNLSNAYWHVSLFYHHVPNSMWTLSFGTSVSSELFQKWPGQALKGLSDVIKVSDVIILYGEGDDINSSAADRDKNLKTPVEKCRTAGMKFNR